MSGFSSALQLADLDDFITPSQECIKPVEIKKTSTGTGSKIKIEDDGSYVRIGQDGQESKLGRVDISLADCLACSGCITTAETVLINQQSHDEMLRVFTNKEQEGYKLIVVSLATQPILSLGEANHLSPVEALHKLVGLFKRLGADLVLEMSLADDLALIEEQKEFLNRLQRFQNGEKDAFPMLASTCPGWVCYAEKTKEFLLKNLSSARSPQQIMGVLIKNVLGNEMKLSRREIYHVSVMPCFDKKLEASRSQFEIDGVRDVDCVVTPVELTRLLEERCQEGLSVEESTQPDWVWPLNKPEVPLSRPEGSGSGGYAFQILSNIARYLNYRGEIVFRDVKKSDLQEAVIEVNGEKVKVAVVTGFKNIQNLVNKMKRGRCDYHYVEVMACPSGCLNGGALIKGQLPQLTERYTSLTTRQIAEWHVLYKTLLAKSPLNEMDLHTYFTPVTYNPNPLNIKW